MKIFISHKKEDSELALSIQQEFNSYGIKSYLDVLDSDIASGGAELTKHIKNNLNSCTDIIVVISEQTRSSWWVPFEIGMSAQIDMPTASFLKSETALPSYLSYWPCLKTTADIGKYISVRKRTSSIIQEQYSYYSTTEKRAIETRTFYEALKKELR